MNHQQRSDNLRNNFEEESNDTSNENQYTWLIQRILSCPNRYYQMLGVQLDASSSQIKSAYRSLLFKLHPDRNDHELANRTMQMVNKAYECLIDPHSRKEYDLKRVRVQWQPNAPYEQRSQNVVVPSYQPQPSWFHLFAQTVPKDSFLWQRYQFPCSPSNTNVSCKANQPLSPRTKRGRSKSTPKCAAGNDPCFTSSSSSSPSLSGVEEHNQKRQKRQHMPRHQTREIWQEWLHQTSDRYQKEEKVTVQQQQPQFHDRGFVRNASFGQDAFMKVFGGQSVNNTPTTTTTTTKEHTSPNTHSMTNSHSITSNPRQIQ